MSRIFTSCKILNLENKLTYIVDVFFDEEIYTNVNEGYFAELDTKHDIKVDSFNITSYNKWNLNNPVYNDSFIEHIESELAYHDGYAFIQLSNFIKTIKKGS